MPVRDRHIIAQRRAYERFVALTAMFRGTWFDRKSKRVEGDFITGVIAEVCYEPRRGRRPKGERPASYVQFTDNFHRSLTEGNLINVDLELLANWSSPTAALLFRHLNKVWHSGRKPLHYERDLKEIACGHLHMIAGNNLKENFGNALREMENRRYLLCCRPNSDSSPSAGAAGGCPSTSTRIACSSLRLLERWKAPRQRPGAGDHRRLCPRRFGNQAYHPRDHELSHAASLVSEFGRDAVLRVLPRVAERVKQQAKEDVYFGFAVPYFRKELAAATSGRHVREVAAATRAKTHVDQVRVDDTIQHRQRRHAALVAAWSTTTASERAAIRARAETCRQRNCPSSHPHVELGSADP